MSSSPSVRTLIQVLAGGPPGLLRVVLGAARGPMTYAAPIAMVALMVVVIAVLEGAKRRRR